MDWPHKEVEDELVQWMSGLARAQVVRVEWIRSDLPPMVVANLYL